MKSSIVKRLLIILLALLGLALSIELAIIYQKANFVKYALSSFCSINDFVDCDGVAKSIYSQFLGIPLAYWGIFYYIIVLFLSVVDKFKNIKYLKFLEVFKAPMAYISTLGVIAFMCSMVLATISLNLINKICILCIVTYFIDLFMAIIASDFSLKQMTANIKTTVLDFISGAKQYTKTFIVLLLLFASFVSYTAISEVFVPHIKKTKAIMKYRKMKFNPYRVQGNLLGVENADVVVEVYSDYVCPICYMNNIMIHQAAKEFKNIKVIHYNYPFDNTCNKYMSDTMHPKACFMSKAVIAAGKQGNYWEMNSLLYERRPRNKKELDVLVEKLNFDSEKFYSDLESAQTAEELHSQIKKGVLKRINATPTMYINGEEVVGMKPYYQLKELLKKQGAKQNSHIAIPAKLKKGDSLKERVAKDE